MNEVARLYVDLDDKAAVGDVLATVEGLQVEEVARSDGLRLAQLELLAPAGFAHAVASLPHSPTGPPSVDTGQALRQQSLDELLAFVRGHPPDGFTGIWSPTVDRDHDVTVHGLNPHVKIADDPPPKQVAPVLPKHRVPAGHATGPRVGIADALLFAHPDLAGRFTGDSLTGSGPYPAPGPGHACVVAGTVLRYCPTAHLVARPALRPDQPNGSWDVAQRLLAFLDDDLDVVNMSFGCVSDGPPSLPLTRAIEKLNHDTVIVAALGNYDPGDDLAQPHYPAAFDTVVAVGAADPDGTPAAITPPLQWLDVLAPNDVVGPFLIGTVTVRDNGEFVDRDYTSGYVSWSGSSFAAAAASGALAQLMVLNGCDAWAARDSILSGTVQVPGITASSKPGA